MSQRGELRQCPTCIQKWPHTPDHDLRGLAWLGELPHRISPSNGDVFIHDGHHQGDRFLLLEIKMAWEFPIQPGQAGLLTAAARLPRWTVRVLRSVARRTVLHRVTSSEVEPQGLVTTTSAVRSAIVSWMEGDAWRDPIGSMSEPWKEARCATCGEPPVGTFLDGSPRWPSEHVHPPFKLGPDGEHILLSKDLW